MTLLTTAEYRTLHSTALVDAALQLLLDAAEADIIDYAGAPGSQVEWFGGGQTMLALQRRAASITSILEHSLYDTTSTTLAADDYLIDPTGLLLYRQGSGTNPRSRFYGRVVVTYAVADDTKQRKVVQSQLVNLTESYSPGVTMTTVGAWTEQYAQAMGAHPEERLSILSQLVSHGRMLVV
jgi:hypothetical protein